jgi:hypothetical protein
VTAGPVSAYVVWYLKGRVRERRFYRLEQRYGLKTALILHRQLEGMSSADVATSVAKAARKALPSKQPSAVVPG